MVTVAEMFTNNDLALRPIHIAAPDAAIRWVATSELPDPTPFFQGGEILLTTGLQTVGWTAQWKAYVEALAKSGTVAMGLATGLTYDQSPRELIDACRSAGFNLFEVPRRTPFVAVSHRVSRLLADEEEAGAREALAVQRKLTAAAAKPDGARAVLPVLAQALRGRPRSCPPMGMCSSTLSVSGAAISSSPNWFRSSGDYASRVVALPPPCRVPRARRCCSRSVWAADLRRSSPCLGRRVSLTVSGMRSIRRWPC